MPRPTSYLRRPAIQRGISNINNGEEFSIDRLSIAEMSAEAIGVVLKLSADATVNVDDLPPSVMAECTDHGYLYRFDDLGPEEFFFFMTPTPRKMAYASYTEKVSAKGGRT